MAIAAVPAYLGHQFEHASPGLRFGMYLPLWGVDRRTQKVLWETRDFKYEKRGEERAERQVPHENKRESLDKVLPLNASDLAAMRAWRDRQIALARPMVEQGRLLTLYARSTAPFTTGLGNEHPLENGFAFLNPYGLPYLPGSGVKGVLRQAARELIGGEWGESQGWTDKATTALFGLESGDGATKHQRGALMFWDVLPQIAGDSLQVEVMTAHQSHYHQGRSDRGSGDSTSPHDSGRPNPINFLTVPPNSGFTFHVQCDVAFLRRIEPALAEDLRWQALMRAVFEHAFSWLGFGAKTAVGYGAMTPDAKAETAAATERAARQRAAEEAAERERRIKELDPIDQSFEAFLDARRNKADEAIVALINATESGRFDLHGRQEVGRRLRERMEAAGKWRPSSSKKNPDKDREHMRTRKVMGWIEGK